MIFNVITKRTVPLLVKNINSDLRIMSQKSILSFFQKRPIATSAVNPIEESPPKSATLSKSPEVRKKRKRINVGSDSEEEALSTSPEKKKCSIEPVPDNDTPSSPSDNVTKSPSNETEKENEIKVNGDLKKDENSTDDHVEEEAKENLNENSAESTTPKPVLKTLSFLATPKRASKAKKTPKEKNDKKKSTAVKSKKTPSPTSKKKGTKKEEKKVQNEEIKTEEKDVAEEKKVDKKNNTGSVFLMNKTSSENTSCEEYFPDKKNYHPIDDAPWNHGQKTPYIALAKTLQKIEETSARLKIVEILSNYLRSVIVLSEDDLLPSIYLCLNKLAPAYEALELGIAETYLMKAIAQSTGRTLAQIKSDVASLGDLGIVAEQSRSNQAIIRRPAPLTVQSVFNQLTTIAKISGKDAMSKKIDKIQNLFVACRECEARFVIRSLAGKMRIGLAEQSVLQALAVACTTTPPNQTYPPEILNASQGISAEEFKKEVDENALIIKTTFCECPDYNKIIPVLLKSGINELPNECKITPGLPVKPMLAQPTKGAREVLERFEGMKFTCEWKYDGERAQIHLMEDGRIRIYSRNQEDNTSKYPDIISNMKEALKPEVKSFILDTEAVAWDREQKKIMPFQILSTRKRKDANESEIKVQVCVFMFDLLYFNGMSLVQKPLIERRKLLKENFQEVDGKFLYVISIDTNTMEEVQECLEESVKGNCEGLMVKTLDTEATYEIAKRSRNWLKLKKDYLEGVGDTLDLVVIGGYTGKGKRTGNYGGFLLASYDSDNEEYQAICKIGTGFSDEMLAQHTTFLKQHIIPQAKSYYRYDSNLEPDHWFDAVQVWEVKCADLSLSPIYHAAIGMVDPEKGISLRFPRFLKIREDKSVEQATTSQQVAEMYRNQDQIKNQGTTATFNEEDF